MSLFGLLRLDKLVKKIQKHLHIVELCPAASKRVCLRHVQMFIGRQNHNTPGSGSTLFKINFVDSIQDHHAGERECVSSAHEQFCANFALEVRSVKNIPWSHYALRKHKSPLLQHCGIACLHTSECEGKGKGRAMQHHCRNVA